MTNRGFSQEMKSLELRAFDHFLRTGRRLPASAFESSGERKFNPNHDPMNGQFTFGAGGSGGARLGSPPQFPARSGQPSTPQSPQAKPQVRTIVGKRPGDPARPRLDPRIQVAEIPGHPQTGRTTWRTSNDPAFIAAANFYNRKYGLTPGDQGYRSPAFLKAWAMRESGGEGDEQAFRTDPFQVNNPGDWPKDGEKARVTGLRKDQRMTPAISAYAALEWLRHKSRIVDVVGQPPRILDDFHSLARYNGNGDRTRQSGNLAHKTWYAMTIFEMVKHAEAGQR